MAISGAEIEAEDRMGFLEWMDAKDFEPSCCGY